MNDSHEPGVGESTRKAAEDFVAAGGDIRRKVRNLTLKALQDVSLDPKQVRLIISDILHGVRSGSKAGEAETKENISAAVGGIDDALAKSATATQYAIEEALGQLKEFNDHDIKRALNDLQGLESVLLEVLEDVANNSSDLFAQLLQDLRGHLSASGSSVGQQVGDSLKSLESLIRSRGREKLIAGADMAKSAGINLAMAASGLLAGLADAAAGVESTKSSDESSAVSK